MTVGIEECMSHKVIKRNRYQGRLGLSRSVIARRLRVVVVGSGGVGHSC